ncbi:Sigma 54-interacting transcriptional regulator [Sulfidibacter corallicola]|uniref:Sigma 54-interacting transcriptional regulator n=1 Tax=Sulfidibacter corallicola TaxID=2818388 RepID=A0A8A4TST8_SULCO|nr:sigma 54-interacting transcriptional regulator [Sulfidibacter corallicola]QTD52224.1 sigma 54-interacting transcriptional regulator [Sulfidibacter corallicola]
MTGKKSHFLDSLNKVRQKSSDRMNRKVLAWEKLLEICRRISSLDLDQVLGLILEHMIELTGTQRGLLMLCDRQGGLKLVRAANMAENQDFHISRSIARQAIAEGTMMVVEDVPTSGVRNRHSVMDLGLTAVLAVPLTARDRVIGVMYVDTDAVDHGLHQLDRGLCDAFAAQAAIAIENAQLHQKLKQDYLFLKEPLDEADRFDMIVYQSRGMQRVRLAIEKVLDNPITVLVQGESGTGKELVAHAIHYQGNRKDKRFVAQNTGALPDTLLESELFGHRRGAFSGATSDKVGLFEIADGGTVFLDEIGEASPAMQVRLLRLLETGTFRRVGETRDRQTDARIIAATHRDLAAEVKKGNFREDLFYRLSVFPIHLPPLRDRREDIPLLVNHFVEEFNRKLHKGIHLIPRNVMEMLSEREWKGNIRELKNFLYRMMVLSPGQKLLYEAEWFEGGMDDASEAEDEPSETASFKTLHEVESDYIRYVLKKVRGNQSEAARILGMKRTTLLARMKKHGIA